MGNAVPPRMCRDEAGTSEGRRRRRRPNPEEFATGTEAAAPRRAAVTPCKQKRGEAEQEQQEAARPGHRRAGADGARDGAATGKAPAATVATTVKIVLRRKDAEALVARLNAQGARERKARMAELKGELRAVDCGASPASCRDAWRPRLAPIKEN